MSERKFKLAAAIVLPLVLAGCATSAEYSAGDAGFTAVEAKVGAGTSPVSGSRTANRQQRLKPR